MTMGIMTRVRGRGAGELRLIGEAAALVCAIRLAQPAVSFATLRRTLDGFVRWRVRDPLDTPSLVAAAIGTASRRLPMRRNCLTEALAAHTMLRRRGYDAELRLGVRKRSDNSRQLDGHAWVAYAGEVVVGHVEDLAGYAECLISCPRE
jgi:hypothetical protein